MMERPILFSAPMVRAILDGRKTQTRRIIRIDDRPISEGAAKAPRFQQGIPTDARNVRMLGYLKCDAPPGSATVSTRVRSPYGEHGDRLWVRESWRSWNVTCEDGDEENHICAADCNQTYVAYAATPRIGFRPRPDRKRICYLDESTPLNANPKLLGPWKPSIHMPRAYSRLLLDVTAVRVERLQDISNDDARAEGVLPDYAERCVEGGHAFDALPLYRRLWDEINADRAPWASNPWVWVVEFRRSA